MAVQPDDDSFVESIPSGPRGIDQTRREAEIPPPSEGGTKTPEDANIEQFFSKGVSKTSTPVPPNVETRWAPEGFEYIDDSPWKRQGGQSSLWRVRRLEDGKKYLLKLYRQEWTAGNERVLTALKGADRNHVVEVQKFDRVPPGQSDSLDARWYVVEELVGVDSIHTLRDLVKAYKGPLYETELRRILQSLTDALVYVHEQLGILHRDLKPENVLVRSRAPTALQLVLTDFASAKVEDNISIADSRLVHAETPLYTAPEALFLRQFDKPADYWSLGMIMVEIVCGAHPLAIGKEAPSDVGIRLQLESREPLRYVTPRLLSHWQPLFQGLLTKVPKRRWASEQIYAFLDGKPLPEPPPYVEEIRVAINVANEYCKTTRELASALARNWELGKQKLLHGEDILKYLPRETEKDARLVSDLADIVNRKNVDEDIKLFRAIVTLDPQVALTFRGVALSDQNHQSYDDLLKVAKAAFNETELANAQGSKTNTDLVRTVFDQRLLDEFATRTGRTKYAEVDMGWRNLIASYEQLASDHEARGNLESALPSRERVMSFMLAAYVSKAFLDGIRRRLRENKELLADAGKCSWFATIGDIKSVDIPRLLLMLLLVPVAAQEVRNERSRRKAEEDQARAAQRAIRWRGVREGFVVGSLFAGLYLISSYALLDPWAQILIGVGLGVVVGATLRGWVGFIGGLVGGILAATTPELITWGRLPPVVEALRTAAIVAASTSIGALVAPFGTTLRSLLWLGLFSLMFVMFGYAGLRESGHGLLGGITTLVSELWSGSEQLVRAGSDVRAVAQPPSRLVQIDECLMYKCGDIELRARKQAPVFSKPDTSSPRIGSISAGYQFRPLNMAIDTIQPQIVRVRERMASAENSAYRFEAGDLIYFYSYWGEGCFTIWTKGRLYGYFEEGNRPGGMHRGKAGISCVMLNPDQFEAVQKGVQRAWFKARLASGQVGWVEFDEKTLE